ncbi:MAG: hypothetical protein K0R26_763 [Bacteroidota bacterium]|jgi:hypothetical protein|nr:hypothetical protein [Bacteroidota bacterium]
MKSPLTRSQYNTDILAKRYAERVILNNLKIIDCIGREKYEEAAKLRDEIKKDLEETAIYIADLTKTDLQTVRDMLVKNNQKIFDTLSEQK